MIYFIMVLWVFGNPVYGNFTLNRELIHDLDECEKAAQMLNANRKQAEQPGVFKCQEVQFVERLTANREEE